MRSVSGLVQHCLNRCLSWRVWGRERGKRCAIAVASFRPNIFMDYFQINDLSLPKTETKWSSRKSFFCRLEPLAKYNLQRSECAAHVHQTIDLVQPKMSSGIATHWLQCTALDSASKFCIHFTSIAHFTLHLFALHTFVSDVRLCAVHVSRCIVELLDTRPGMLDVVCDDACLSQPVIAIPYVVCVRHTGVDERTGAMATRRQILFVSLLKSFRLRLAFCRTLASSPFSLLIWRHISFKR